ncbi:MAG: hypothetical protein H6594_06580 [Flavobacteriales bacterium]|nr:hypothetical protein [Flavobacteriales bacterium]
MLRGLPILVAIVLALIACAGIPRPRGRVFTLLGVGLLAALIVETFGMWGLVVRPEVPNMYAYNLYMAVELVVLLLLLHAHKPAWGRWYLAAGGLVVVVAARELTTYDPVRQLLTPAVLVDAILMTLLLVALLWDMAQRSTVPLQRMPRFWLFMGLLVYFGGLVPIIGLTPYLVDLDPHLAARIYVIMPILATVRYLLAAVAALLERQRRRTAHPYDG